jgi:hypothetical protein
MVRGVNGIGFFARVSSVGQNADFPRDACIFFLSITKGVVGLGGKFIAFVGFLGTEKNLFNFPEKKCVIREKMHYIFFSSKWG